MKQYKVTIEYKNGRKNSLVAWADCEEDAIRWCMKCWGNPKMYNSIKCENTHYV